MLTQILELLSEPTFLNCLYFVSGEMDTSKFKIIFDIRDEPAWFTLQDFGRYAVPIEAALAIAQLRGLPWPLGHLSHVSGFLTGVFLYHVYLEARYPGHFRWEMEKLARKFE